MRLAVGVSLDSFEWGLIGLFSALLGILALVLGVFFNFLPACHASPTPLICSGFVTLPMIYSGLAGILVALGSLTKIRSFKKVSVSDDIAAKSRSMLFPLRQGIGVFLYLVGLSFVVWTFILSIPFSFELSPNHFLEVGEIGPQNLPQILLFDAGMLGLLLLGSLLAPSVRRKISLYSAVGVIVGAAFGGWNILMIILRFAP